MSYTLNTAVVAFLRAKRRRLAESSYREYSRVMDKMLEDLGAELEVSELEPPRGTETIEEFLDDRWGAAPHAYNRNLSVIRGFMKFVIQREHLVHDPCAPLERAKPEKHARSTFNDENVHAIIDAAVTPRDKIALRLLLVYGLRKGALTNLQLLCFDLDHKMLSFKTKGRKYHVIPIASDEIWHDLELIDGDPSEYLLHRRGKPEAPLSPHGVHCWWYARLEDAGVVQPGTTSGQRLHKARHTAGQRVLNATGNLKAAQMLLGHASIQTTGDVYSLDVDTPIMTTVGWKTMGTVDVDDFVYAEDGSSTRVVATSRVFVDSDCYAVSFADGATIVASGDHRWKVWDSQSKQWRSGSGAGDAVLTTSEIAASYSRWGRARYRVRNDAVVEGACVNLPIDPYVLGYWLGDGCCGTACIAVGTKDIDHIESQILDAGYKLGSKYFVERREDTWGSGWVLTVTDGEMARNGVNNSIPTKLRKLEVFNYGQKHIPDIYQRASVDQRLALLQGLMDSDGCITHCDGKIRCQFGSVFPALAQDVLSLVRGLGARTAMFTKKTKTQDQITMQWTPTFDPFRMTRKSSRFIPPLPQDERRGRRNWAMNVVDVQRVSSIPTRCIAVEHDSHVFLVGRTFIPTHNTGWDNESLRTTMQDIDL